MNTAPDSRKISLILRMLREGSLLPTPEFQRRAVWTAKDKVAFIETILKGFPFPEIYVASGDVDTKSGDATELLVDGQQRIRTIEEYFKGTGAFKLTRSIPKYSQLSEPEKLAFLDYNVASRHLGTHKPEIIREIFTRMNATSYDLNEFERFNAVYIGEFKKFVENLAQEPFFTNHRIFSLADIRRMKDVSYIASLVSTMIGGYFNRDDEIEDFLEQYNEEFPAQAEYEARFLNVLQAIDNMYLPQNCRAFRKVDFYVLFIELDRILKVEGRQIAIEKAGASLVEFYAAVDAQRDNPGGGERVQRYFEASLQNTNDRSQRIARANVIQSILEEAAS